MPSRSARLSHDLEGVEGDRARDRHSASKGDDANHCQAAVLELNRLQLLELLWIAGHGRYAEVARALVARVLALPVDLKRADREDHLPDARTGHLGGGEDRVARGGEVGERDPLRRRDEALEVRAG